MKTREDQIHLLGVPSGAQRRKSGTIETQVPTNYEPTNRRAYNFGEYFNIMYFDEYGNEQVVDKDPFYSKNEAKLYAKSIGLTDYYIINLEL